MMLRLPSPGTNIEEKKYKLVYSNRISQWQKTEVTGYNAPSTKVIMERVMKVLIWYDNEYGYARRMLD